MTASLRLPPHVPGMRIGLFGGSFDPPHEGHLLASHLALTRLRLDRLWWLVSPGNPLKDTSGLATLDQRIAACRARIRDPRVVVTALEAGIKTRYTAETLAYLHRRRPDVRFVWVMGADNLLQFHRWRDWEQIALTTPICIIDRPGATLRASGAKLMQRFPKALVAQEHAPRLASIRAPAIVYLHGPRNPQSSTALRQRR